MRLFLDTEFTGLHQNTTLISLALVAEDGEEFYAEFNDYNIQQITEWIEVNVLTKLEMQETSEISFLTGKTLKMKGDRTGVASYLKKWLLKFDRIEIWADVLAYDWVLFCELFGGALEVPPNIFYAPFDLSTVFRLRGMIDPLDKFSIDISRFEFVDSDSNRQHHALNDARVEKACFEKLFNHLK